MGEENCNVIKDRITKVTTLGEDDVWKTLQEYFENLYVCKEEHVLVLMCGFDGVSNCNYFGGDSVNRTKVELRMKKLRNDQAASNNEVARKVLELEWVSDWLHLEIM